MKIGLCDVDGHNFPNLPLMKLAAYHKQRGDTVGWWMPLEEYDVVYKSKVFTFTQDIEYLPRADLVIEGGTGYGRKEVLPDEIEHITPDYSIYPQFKEAYGFLTRGCPRGCAFCIVADKEGRKSHKVADLGEFWTGQREIKLLDPNLLACKEREDLLRQLIASGALVDFTQGLDVRFVNRDNVELLKQVRVRNIHFAWDNPKEDLRENFAEVKRALELDERKMTVYTLTNFNSTLEEDLMRIYTLRDLGFTPYVMIYNKGDFVRSCGRLKPMAELLQTFTPEQIEHFKTVKRLQGWVNNKRIFRTVERFEDCKR